MVFIMEMSHLLLYIAMEIDTAFAALVEGLESILGSYFINRLMEMDVIDMVIQIFVIALFFHQDYLDSGRRNNE